MEERERWRGTEAEAREAATKRPVDGQYASSEKTTP